MNSSPVVIKVGGALLDDAAAMQKLFLSIKNGVCVFQHQ